MRYAAIFILLGSLAVAGFAKESAQMGAGMLGTITIPMPKPEELPPAPDLNPPSARPQNKSVGKETQQKVAHAEVNVAHGLGEPVAPKKTAAKFVWRTPLSASSVVGLLLLIVLGAAVFWAANAMVLRQAPPPVKVITPKPASGAVGSVDKGPAA